MATPTRRREVSLREERSYERRSSLTRGSDATRDRLPIRTLIITLVLLAVLLAVALVGFIVLSNMPIFTITSIDTEDTEHLSMENIAKLANVEEGTTLLTLDESTITQNLMRNPWVKSVSYAREFPDRLRITVTERRVACLVKMSTGSVCWCLSDDNAWIEPVSLSVSEGQSADDVALALAQSMDAILVTDVPTSVSPSAGAAVHDDEIKAVNQYLEQFSKKFTAQIVSFTASGEESISCTLKSGVVVSLGAPNNIELKEQVIEELLAKHPNQITYINVRVPAQASYRKLDVDTVKEGSGVEVDESIITNPSTNETTTSTTPNQPEGQNQDGEATSEGDATAQDDTAQTDQDAQDAEGDVDYSEGDYGEGYADDYDGDYDEGGDTGEYILGDDGNYYSYEEYWGLN